MKFQLFIIIAFFTNACFSQMNYNHCNTALLICPNQTISINNHGANKTLCGGCEDDFNFCFSPFSTIWLKFTTNELGGTIQINLSNPIFEIITGRGNSYNANVVEATIPCNSTSYTLMGNCISNATNNQTINIPTANPNTTYYIVLSGDTTGATLPAEFSIDVTISGTAIDRPIPSISISTPPSTCENDIVTFYSTRTNCTDSTDFFWFINGIHVATSAANDSSFSTTNINNGDIIHVETHCFQSCPVTISDSTLPLSILTITADAGPDQTIKANEIIQLQGTIGTNSVVFWTPSYALSNQNIHNPIANPQQTTTYTMWVRDTLTGCEKVDYVTITIDKGLFIPNTFSPNGDGENDKWEILGIEAYPDCWVTIYNRWGQLVFQSTGYNKEKAWNGEGSTGKMHEGVYFYEIQLRDSEKQTLKGYITLVR